MAFHPSNPGLQCLRRRCGRPGRILGITLVEIMVTVAIVGIFLASIYAMNSQLMLVIRSTRNQSSASRILEERTEQLRMAGWTSITDPEILRQLVSLPMRPESSGWFAQVNDVQETVTVTGLNSQDLSELNSNIVVRRQNGSTAVSSSGILRAESLVRVDVELAWKEGEREVPPRKTSATISPGGFVSASLSESPFVGVNTYNGGVTAVADPILSSGVSLSGVESVVSTALPTPTPVTGTAVPKFCKHGRPWPHCGDPPKNQ